MPVRNSLENTESENDMPDIEDAVDVNALNGQGESHGRNNALFFGNDRNGNRNERNHQSLGN